MTLVHTVGDWPKNGASRRTAANSSNVTAMPQTSTSASNTKFEPRCSDASGSEARVDIGWTPLR